MRAECHHQLHRRSTRCDLAYRDEVGCEAEVDEGDLLQRLVEQQVLGLEVPVHDAVVVACLHGLYDLAEQRSCSVLCDASLGHQLVKEGPACAVFHDLRRAAIVSTGRFLDSESCAQYAP